MHRGSFVSSSETLCRCDSSGFLVLHSAPFAKTSSGLNVHCLSMEGFMTLRRRKVVLGVIGFALLTSGVHSQEIPQGPPFKSVPCNMNCSDKGNITAIEPTRD